MKHSTTEDSALTSCSSQYSIGVFETPNGYLIQSRSCRMFLTKAEAESMKDDFQEFVWSLNKE